MLSMTMPRTLSVVSLLIASSVAWVGAPSVPPRSPSSDCAGGAVIAPVSAHPTITGSTVFTYVGTDGLEFSQTAPPPGFDPLTASAAALKEAGFPDRPALPSALADWTSNVADYKGSNIVGGVLCERADRSDRLSISSQSVVPASSVGHTGHTFWSGYKNVGSGGGYYGKVVGHFEQPSVSNTANAAMTSWLGLADGGNSKSVLLQAGTVNDVGSPTVGTPFWEIYCTWSTVCNGIIYPPGAGKAGPGDDVSVLVSFDGAHLPTPIARFQVAINGVLQLNVSTASLPSGATTGGSALYITERFTSPLRNIPTFALMGFSSLRTYSTWNGTIAANWGDQPYFAYEMTRNGAFYTPPCSTNSNILMYPGYTSRTGFYNFFCRAS